MAVPPVTTKLASGQLLFYSVFFIIIVTHLEPEFTGEQFRDTRLC